MKSFKIQQSITNRNDESLKLFFKDISKLPMIDINKEIELSKRIQSGDEEAVNELVKANLRFAVSVAKQYQNKGLPLTDLIQEAVFGMIQAARKYDGSKNFRFITYAVWWIRQSIIHALTDQCRTIRVPMNQIVSMNKINKASEIFEKENGRKPCSEELAYEFNIDSKKIDLTKAAISKCISFDTPFDDEDANCLMDVIPNKNVEDPNNNIEQDNISKGIEKVLSKLSYRERDVLRMSFGIGMPQMQNEEIANRFGIGTERVRQIQNEAITKIRMRYKDDLKELI